MSAIDLLNFNVLIKGRPTVCFFHPRMLIKTKYKCQEEDKVETETSI